MSFTKLSAQVATFSAASLLLGVAVMAAAGPLETKDDPVQLSEAQAEQLAGEVKALFEKQLDEVKEIADKALTTAKTGEKSSEDLKAQWDEKITGMNEVKAGLDELEKKLARFQETKEGDDLTAGQAFTSSDEYKSLIEGGIQQGRIAAVEIKALTSLTTDADGSVGDMVRPDRIISPMELLPDRRMTIRDLLAPGQTASNAFQYVQETGFTNNAGMVAEGTLKPESSIKMDLTTVTVKKMAHWMLASSEILEDAPRLRSIIDYRLLYGLDYLEENQFLNGDGTGQNLHGIIPQATAYSAAFSVTAETEIDKVRLGILQAALAEYPATATVMHPSDWAKIETTKDTQGRYIIGNPQGTARPTLWSLPVVATQAMTIDKFLCGAFSQAAQIFDRTNPTVLASTEDSDNFRKNMVTILAERRTSLAVYRPEAFIYGDFGNVA